MTPQHREMVLQDLYHGASPDWIRDCYRWRGRPLLGQHGHWCPEWDELPIDETTPEWPCACDVGIAYEKELGK